MIVNSTSLRTRGSVRVRRRKEPDNTKSVQGGGNLTFGDVKLDLTGASTRTQKCDPLRSEYSLRMGSTARTINYDASRDPPFSVVNVQPDANQTLYSLNSVNHEVRDAVAGRADVTIPFGMATTPRSRRM